MSAETCLGTLLQLAQLQWKLDFRHYTSNSPRFPDSSQIGLSLYPDTQYVMLHGDWCVSLKCTILKSFVSPLSPVMKLAHDTVAFGCKKA